MQLAFWSCAHQPSRVQKIPLTLCHQCKLWSEALNMARLFFYERVWDQLREVCVLDTQFFEPPVQVLLQCLPQGIPIWSDDHGSTNGSIVCQLCPGDNIKVPPAQKATQTC